MTVTVLSIVCAILVITAVYLLIWTMLLKKQVQKAMKHWGQAVLFTDVFEPGDTVHVAEITSVRQGDYILVYSPNKKLPFPVSGILLINTQNKVHWQDLSGKSVYKAGKYKYTVIQEIGTANPDRHQLVLMDEDQPINILAA